MSPAGAGTALAVGIVGMGKMGGNMARRLLRDGHRVVGFDIDASNLDAAAEHGVEAAGSVADLVTRLEPPRGVWVMVPHGDPTESTVDALLEELDPGDTIVDGGNSRWVDSMRLAERCAAADVSFLDVGVSGGVWGLEEGYCMMIGGPEEAFRRLEPAFRTLAPEDGYAHVGGSGAGHFVKMIHNGIEYAQLQALGEGFEALHRSRFDLDLRQIAELWRHGAVVRSWLLDLLVRALETEGNELERIADYVDDSGMGRWTVEYAVDEAVPLPAITNSLFQRFASRQEERFSAKVIAALRNQFGGHAVKEEEDDDGGGDR